MNDQKTSINLKIDKEIHKKLKYYALDYDTSMSAVIEKLLKNHLEENGYFSTKSGD